MSETRIYPAFVNADQLTSADAVVNFEVQADMLGGEQWLEPVIPSSAIRQYDAQVESLSGNRGGIGRGRGSIIFAHCTPLMLQYLRARLFPANGWWQNSTITVLDAYRGWVVFHCKLQWNEPAEHHRLAAPAPGYFDVKIDFVEGILAPDGGEFDDEAFSDDFAIGGLVDG